MAIFASTQISDRKVLTGKVAPRLRTVRFTADLTAQGGQTNTIGAAALGFRKIWQVSNILDFAADVIIPTTTDGSKVYTSVFSTDKYGIADVTIDDAVFTVTGEPV